jgi:hypothetical protein
LPKRKGVRGVTVCIAAVCRDHKKNPVFVLCSDNKLDAGDWGSYEAASKLYSLGWNWAAMMAGTWSTARGLCSALEESISRNGRTQSKEDSIKLFHATAGKFAASVLCKQEHQCELLITGFHGPKPIMICLSIRDKQADYEIFDDFWATGLGSQAAMYMLQQREQNPLGHTLEQSCYHVYEAKRFSEIVTSVGPSTRIGIHRPAPEQFDGGKYSLCFNALSDNALGKLEEMRGRFGLPSLWAEGRWS